MPNIKEFYMGIDGECTFEYDNDQIKKIKLDDSNTGSVYYVKGLVNDGNCMQMTGTDNTAILQAEINKAIYINKVSRVVVPAGNYALTDTVHLGYGVNNRFDTSPYVTVIFEGAGGSGINTGSSGTNWIWRGPKDRPVFAFSAAHQSRMKKMAIRGGSGYLPIESLGSDYIDRSGLNFSWNIANSHQISTWNDPRVSVPGTGIGTSGSLNGLVAGSGNGTSTTAPWCAVAVDPYVSPVAPSPAYPTISYPADCLDPNFIASPTQYNRPASTDLQFEDVFITSFTVGIVVAPGGYTGQSDFCKYDRLWIQNCVLGISVNGSNPRENSVKDCYINQCWAGISTGLHATVANGSAGQWGAAVVNTAFDRCIKWAHFNSVGSQYTGNVTFLNCYGENAYSLVTYGKPGTGSAEDDGNLILQSCMAIFNHTGLRGVPARIIETSDNAGCTIIGGSYSDYIGAFSAQVAARMFSITGMARFKKAGTPTSLYEKIADNGTGGGVVCRATSGPSFGDYSSKYKGYNSSGAFNEIWCQNIQSTSANNLGNWYAHSFFGTKFGNRSNNPRPAAPVGMTSSTNNITLVGRDLTWTWNSNRSTQQLALTGYGVGDAFLEQSTGYVFYIYSSTASTLKALMMTGWAISASAVNVGGNGVVSGYSMSGNNFPPQTVTLTFSSASAYTVSGSIQGAMGSGTVGSTFSGTGGLGFKVEAGSTPFANGNTITLTIGYSYANGWSPSGSYVTSHMNCRMFAPGSYVVATATSGSNSLTACANDAGNNSNVASALPPNAGITLWAESETDNMFYDCGQITANSAGTITLTSNATKSGTRQLNLAARVFTDQANP